LGAKIFFSGGPHPKTGSKLVAEAGGFVELGKRYKMVKKFLKNSQGLPRYLGSKKNLWRHLAAKLEPFRWKWKGAVVGGVEVYNV